VNIKKLRRYNMHLKLKMKEKEDGNWVIIDAKEKPDQGGGGWKDLEYAEEEEKVMDDGNSHIDSNPCRWRKFSGKWRCIG
jgi:hypothetical protein